MIHRAHTASYMAALRASVATSATPYGYTLTIWTSGAVLVHARGFPAAPEALLFLVGAAGAFALLGALAFAAGGEQLAPEPASAVLAGGLHVFSVGLAIGATALVADGVGGVAAWPLGGLVSTGLYLLVSAFQLSLAQAARNRPPRRAR